MEYRHTVEHHPPTVFAVALSCCLAFWLALGLLILEWSSVADAAYSAARLLHRILA